MDRWEGKVAVVTGASAGIGAAIVVDLLKAGMIVVGLARRHELVEALRQKAGGLGVLHSIKCDVTSEKDIRAAFTWVDTVLGGVEILINNAGIIHEGINMVTADNTEAIRSTIDTNIMAVVLCTREAFQIMKRRSVDGHIVIINGIDGHSVPYIVGMGATVNIYPATKHAVTAMTEVLRQEFQMEGTNVKISSVSPGMTRTDITTVHLREMLHEMPMLEPEEVSASVMYVLRTAPHVQIHELIVKPVGERF